MASDGTTLPQDPTNTEEQFAEEKGKGKAAEHAPEDTAMDEDDDDDDEDDEEDEEETGEAAEEDGMEEIDLDNIVEGRTRGQVIDFAKAAEDNPAEDDDDEDDDDFQPPDEDSKMSG